MKKIVTIFMLVIFGLSLYASPVSQEAAQKVAVSFYKHYNTRTSDYTVSDVVTNTYNGLVTFYVFNFSSGGYVMVSADDAVTPVLASSETDTYDQNNISPNELSWLEGYSKEIEYIVNNNIDNTETVKQWKNIQKSVFNDTKAVVTPLCSTTWDQGCYYNASCPSDASATWSCGHVYTGCVATSMAQVMKKWNYPTTGVGTHTYTDPTYGSQTASFGTTTYGWGSMPNNVSSTNASVATLMYHCGVSVNMTYGVNGSGAYSWDVPNALISYFNYSPSAEIQFKDNFIAANWITLLETELNNGRPVYYSGDDGTSGHAWVCDGYNASNQFHMNWGWSGSSNNYYTMGTLNPSSYTFNSNNAAVIRIMPPVGQPVANFSASTTTPAVGGTVNFTDASTGSPTTWSWTFDGGSPSTSNLQTPPSITYATAGFYQVSLTVSNANGTDTKTRAGYINVGGTPSAWIKQNSAFTTASRGVNSICIVNPYIVWAGAYDGTSVTNYIQQFTRTVNGGNTWMPGTITYTGSTTQAIANMCAFNDTVCYAAMYPGAAANGGYIAKTIDGGTTWSIANSPSFSTSWLDFVYFFDINNGVAVGDPSGTDYVIYTTNNGGTSWNLVSAATLPNCTSSETAIVNQFDAVGNTIWFGTTKGRMYKSTDKGLTWTVATVTGFTTSTYVTPIFKDANVGIAVGTTTTGYYGIKKTSDGGSTWNALAPTGFYVKIPNLDYVPGTTAMWVDGASGPGTGSSYSNNDCSSFLEIDTASTIQYTCVKFYDINTGWAGSFNTSSTDGGIYKWDPDVVVGVKDIESSTDHIAIYPNPANDYLQVAFTQFFNSDATINIYNLMGELVYTQHVNPSFNDVVMVDLSTLKSGMYMVNVNDGEKVISEKVTVIK